MSDFAHLLAGYRNFKATSYEEQRELITHLIDQGLKPSTLIITACSLRISPYALFSCAPGELYVVRNAAGLVPPYENQGVHGVTAAIEYAINNLNVDTAIVLGHAHCEGIKSLLLKGKSPESLPEPMKNWLSIADEAIKKTNEELDEDCPDAEKEFFCEQETILASLKNLLNFPCVKDRISKNDINIYGWHFNIESGILSGFNPESHLFEVLS